MTSSVFDEKAEMLQVATAVRDTLTALTQSMDMHGHEVSVIVTRREEDDTLSQAVISTIDDHGELLETLGEVVEDCLAPYLEDADDDDDSEPELPFTKVTLQ